MNKVKETFAVDNFKRMKELVSFEIYNSLPRLDDNEMSIFNDINCSSKHNTEKYKEFYDFLKKKYTDYIQLSYLQYESLHSYYIKQVNYDLYKPVFKTDFDFVIYLHSFYTKDKDSYISEFKGLMNGRMRTLDCLDVFTKENEWSSIEINEDYMNDIITNETMMTLLKYNPNFIDNCVLFSISFFYENIYKDLYEILMYHKDITHLIFDIKSMKIYNKVDTLNEEGFNEIMNMILKVIIDNNTVKCVLFKNQGTKMTLNAENSRLVVKLLSLYKVIILVLDNISLIEEIHGEFVNEIYKNYMIKFLYLNGTEFKAESLVEFDEKYNTKLDPAEQNKVCLIRFDKEHRFENFHVEKVEDKQSGFASSKKGSKLISFDSKSKKSSAQKGLLFDSKSTMMRSSSRKKRRAVSFKSSSSSITKK